MSNLDTLKAAYLVQVEKIADPIIKANATVLLDEFIALKTAYSELSSQTLDSYSIAQRSIQRRRIADMSQDISNKQMELERAMFGFCSIGFMSNRNEDYSTP